MKIGTTSLTRDKQMTSMSPDSGRKYAETEQVNQQALLKQSRGPKRDGIELHTQTQMSTK